MRKPLLVAGLLLSLAACHKTDDAPGLDFGAGDGISYRDASGMANGTQDPTDWTADATWTAQEKALFPELSISLEGAPQTSFLDRLTLYPNPAAVATWAVVSKNGASGPSPFSTAAVLVSRDVKEVLRLPHGYAGSGYYATAFDYAKLGLTPGERYRLYYVVFNGNGLILKGHGDVRYGK
ncbi:hypothetical protein GKZ68_19975 [Hymenobacter sp. BRD128]|uniref:hypothetical protein n=1 Tax=Hymenobacter sp. BRD128 TaxID=2675878 RepID=UPI0015651781|nr:hypothetical protein [Hymenobacter sp. BRD128]QKG58709.1 hypothetical protein GKZ68_19975 [Hymenobacter sp. BRD128]